MKKTLFFTLCIALFLLLTFTVLAADKRIEIRDDENLLTAAEEADLASLPLADTGEVTFYLYTLNTAAANDYPLDNRVFEDCGIESGEAAVVLVIRTVRARTGDYAVSKFYYDFYTYNEAQSIFSDGDVDRILDDSAVYDNIKAGNCYAGAKAFFSLCAARISSHYEELTARRDRAPLTAAITGLIVGAIAAGCSVLGVFLYYRRKKHGESYPLEHYATLKLTAREDRFVGSYVTRVRVQSNNGGSGGGGRSGGHRGGR